MTAPPRDVEVLISARALARSYYKMREYLAANQMIAALVDLPQVRAALAAANDQIDVEALQLARHVAAHDTGIVDGWIEQLTSRVPAGTLDDLEDSD